MTRQEYLTWVNDPNKFLFMENFIVEVIPAPHETVEDCVFILFSDGQKGLALHDTVIPRSELKPAKSGREVESRRYWSRAAVPSAIEAYNRYIEKYQMVQS